MEALYGGITALNGGVKHMDNDDWDHFVGSVSEQLLLMFWTALFTVGGVGFILMLAL
jgi:hypothetical protein